ncbi:hypothetical protein PHYSODRAFT_475914 [Phytophthora sojae]|uniref:SWIM-type domain-containing protein n=1 Tax=Phytophthora sojae (strain P6497) TaxID=1094619 RepID=G4YFB7_PHYSP|nr:hypothetical protein PHYSODRAFT_475914 [Phytophthora sojae]EGZ28343.1 hypothetical protein PHYSODRAFT_475914 [Phytophthora sojae]|eukprot:XP_009515618.1 hypothetical protein PHYSODRAFT_475914 [Phytophthora sojae]
MEIGSEPIQHFAAGPVSAEVLEAGVLLCNDDNHFPCNGPTLAHYFSLHAYYFNQRYYIVRDDNVHGLKVNASRTKTYERSVSGSLKDDEIVENVQFRYLSLHKVAVLDRLPYEHDWNSPLWSLEEINTIRKKFKCDCKDFYQTRWLCAHVLACLHLVDNLDLTVMLRGLPTRRPPGRPRKKSKCLQ